MSKLQRLAVEKAFASDPGHGLVFQQLPNRFTIGLSVKRDLAVFAGDPVWLASVSLRAPIEPYPLVPQDQWPPAVMNVAQANLSAALDGVGDVEREWCYAAGTLIYLERAFQGREVARLPNNWREEPHGVMAPMKVFWTTGIPDVPAARPCEAPERRKVFAVGPTIESPGHAAVLPCGKCGPCAARRAAGDQWTTVEEDLAAPWVRQRVGPFASVDDGPRTGAAPRLH